MTPALANRSPFVGRRHELAAVLDRLAAAWEGHGSTLVLIGEAGIGKSRLVAEAAVHAGRQGFLVLQGVCFETDGALPYAPLLDLVRTLLAGRDPSRAVELLAPAAPELVKLLPELASTFPGVIPAPALEPEPEKRRMFAVLSGLILRMAAAQPALVVLEDLHWSDDTSMEFLQYLARRVADHPVLLLLTCRDDETRPGLDHLLAELHRERLAVELPLTRFAPAEVDTLIRAVFGQERPVRADFLDAVYGLTEGNPFFVEEVLRSLVAGGDIFYAGGRWDRRPLDALRIPRTIQDAVRRRVERLSPAAHQALVLAAVAGRRFDFGILRELTGQDEPGLLELIKEMIAAHLVVEESAERFAFQHALTRQAIVSTLLTRERQSLHRQIAETIEHCAGALDMHAADLGYHFHEAGAWAKALEYARRAGEQAQAMYDPRAAVEHFTRALGAARALALPPPPSLFRSRGQAYETLGEFEAARADHEAALAVARAAGDRPAEWQALLDLGFLWAARDYGRCGGYFEQTLALARQMEEPSLIAASLNRVGNWHLNAGRPHEARRHHEEALAIFERLADRRGIAATLDLLGLATLHGGDLFGGTAYYKRAATLFRELDDRRGLAGCLVMLAAEVAGQHLAWFGATEVTGAPDEAKAVRLCEQALTIAREIGWSAGEAHILGEGSWVLAVQGAYAHALEWARAGLAVAEEIEHRQWIGLAQVSLGMIYADLLALPTARRHLQRALALADEIGSEYWGQLSSTMLALIFLQEGDCAAARAVLDGRFGRDVPTQTILQRLNWRIRGELALAGGDADEALAIADRLIASAANLTPTAVIPSLWLLRGRALAALSRTAEAEDALRAARRVVTERPMLWRIHLALGKVYQAGGRPAEAEREFAVARAVVEDLAAGVPDDRDAEIGGSLREHFLRSSAALLPRARPLTPLRAAKQAYGGLTAREREVAALIARGRSNREIAEALVVGERTVQTHIANIFAKLGVGSRAQVAAWASEKGLLRDTE
jgi:DNA-binding CsgD family transcriptional regulator/Flp pilus assembly protein TadD